MNIWTLIYPSYAPAHMLVIICRDPHSEGHSFALFVLTLLRVSTKPIRPQYINYSFRAIPVIKIRCAG